MTNRYPIWRVLRTVLATLLFGFAACALAQQPLTAPNYAFGALPTLRLDRPLDGELAPGDGQNFRDGSYLDLYRVAGSGGERVLIEMSSAAFDSYLVLYDLDGFEVGSNDDGPGGGFGDSLLDVVLPSDGEYLLVATSFFGGIGGYTLTRVSSASRFGAAEPALFGVSQGTLDGTETRALSFELEERTSLRIGLSSTDFDTVLTIYDLEGNEVAYNDDANGTDSELLITLDAGAYYLVVAEFYGGPGGEYTLEMVRLQAVD